jgi:hypothetical protein
VLPRGLSVSSFAAFRQERFDRYADRRPLLLAGFAAGHRSSPLDRVPPPKPRACSPALGSVRWHRQSRIPEDHKILGVTQTVDASRAACASYGFQPGSDAFANCVMTEQHRHTLRIALRPTAAPAVPVPQAPELPAVVMPVQALQPLAQPRQPHFCFGTGAFEQCQ